MSELRPEGASNHRPTPQGSFSLAASLGVRRGNIVGPMAFAGLFALVSTAVLPWWWPAAWIAALALWEFLATPAWRRVQALSAGQGLPLLALLNFVSSWLYGLLALAALGAGKPLGVAIGVTWLAGSFVNAIIYFSDNRMLLTAVLVPPVCVAIAGSLLGFGPTSAALVALVVILANLVAAAAFKNDHPQLLRRLAERQCALADAERKLSIVVEAAGDGIYEADLDLRTVNVSAGWAAMLGYDFDQLPALTSAGMMALVHPDDRAPVEQEFFAHFRGETPHTTSEQRMLCKDGSYKWVLSRARLIDRTPDGRPRRLIGTLIDISARKALEFQLATARDLAEEANAAKSMFVANMSHEIRTPLNGVIGIIGALARTELSAPQRDMVELVQSSAQVLERLLTDVLDQSKLEAGEFELQPAPFELTASVEAAAELMRPRAEAKGLDFEVRLAPTAQGVFCGDAARVQQIIYNLAANAIKFTDAGRVRVEVDAAPSDGARGAAEVRIAVSDTGIGFDPETADRLFMRFVQGDGSVSRRYGGTGLGLAISKALAEMMGGWITAASTPGAGSRFEVMLPLERLEAQPADRTAAEATELGVGMAGLRILVAEDHPTNQRVLQLILAPFGADLTIANDGVEAVEAFRTGAFDLVLMDMQMPRMDGLSAVREIRRLEHAGGAPPIPIAMLTANAMDEHKQMASKAGADGHIAKPVTPQSLLGGIARTLQERAGATERRVAG